MPEPELEDSMRAPNADSTRKPKRGRGRPLKDVTKVATSIRLDACVIDAFRATGTGWQTRMNEALLEYVARGMLPGR